MLGNLKEGRNRGDLVSAPSMKSKVELRRHLSVTFAGMQRLAIFYCFIILELA